MWQNSGIPPLFKYKIGKPHWAPSMWWLPDGSFFEAVKYKWFFFSSLASSFPCNGFKCLEKLNYDKEIIWPRVDNKYLDDEKINLTKAFQRRFRQNLINGKIDQECFLISKNLMKSWTIFLEIW